jgi:outer membrane protein OmpA-like peptidoglycan-associated protein
MKKIFFLLFQIVWLTTHSQTIFLQNPSFEDIPEAGHTPKGWLDASGNAPAETPPDVQPNPTFGLQGAAKEGTTYLGLVVRDNGTCESVGQILKTPLVGGVTYRFNLWACRSLNYKSQSRKTGQAVNYNMPVLIELWGCAETGKPEKLSISSKPIETMDWQKIDFEFTPQNTYNYFAIKAIYTNSTPYNGNVLIDNASAIVPKKQQKDDAKNTLVQKKTTPTSDKSKAEKPKNPAPQITVSAPIQVETKTSIPENKTPTKNPEPTKPKPENLLSGTIKNLQFPPESAVIKEASYPALDEIYTLLKNNPNIRVEIGGHTNLVVTDGTVLSTKRAEAVANYLAQKGIDKKRLVTKGYGNSSPKIKNDTSPEANKINQRVEIRVLTNSN